MAINNVKVHLKKLISKSKTNEAMNELLKLEWLPNNIVNELTLLSNRFHKNENENRVNTSTNEVYKNELAQINKAFLDIIDELPENRVSIENKDKIYQKKENGINLENNTAKIELKINADFNDFTKDEQKNLEKVISLLLGLDGDFDIKFRKSNEKQTKLSTQNFSEVKILNEKGKIDRDRVITISFPDTTYTLVKFELQETTLLTYYTFEDTIDGPTVPYENSYHLSAFNINGKIDNIEFRRKN